MSSITISNETIHGIVRRVKHRSSPFLTETQGEKELYTSWEARHQVSGLMRITKLIRQSWLLAQQGGALPHHRRTRDSVRGGASGFQWAKRSAFATEKANGQREGSRLSRTLAKLDSHSEALRVSEAL
ncbi:hypothetical protein Tco_0316594 [Tanacetum coccineum]